MKVLSNATNSPNTEEASPEHLSSPQQYGAMAFPISPTLNNNYFKAETIHKQKNKTNTHTHTQL